MRYAVYGIDKDGNKRYATNDVKRFSFEPNMTWEKEKSANNVIKAIRKARISPNLTAVVRTLKVEEIDDGVKVIAKKEKQPYEQFQNKIDVSAIELKEEVPHPVMDILPDDVIKMVGSAAKLDEILPELKIKLPMKIAAMEQETQDILHAIELGKFNASEGYRYSKTLHEIRQKRRKLKDSINIIMTYDAERQGKCEAGTTTKMINELSNRSYRPRTNVLDRIDMRYRLCEK